MGEALSWATEVWESGDEVLFHLLPEHRSKGGNVVEQLLISWGNCHTAE